MGKKYRNLIGRITDEENLRDAYRRTAMGRRDTAAFLEFKEYASVNLDRLQQELVDGTYRQGPLRQFTVYEPKARLISALSFRDRIAQHALVNIIGPIFEATLLPRTYACRAGMGTHAAAKAVQACLRRMHRQYPSVYVLKTDFAKYFPSIDRVVLLRLIRKKISCVSTLRLIEVMVPPERYGLPIGCLTSQLFANVYGGVVDRFLQARGVEWFRYMDDIIVIGPERPELLALKHEFERFALEDLGLRLSKWSLLPAARGVNFVGYRMWHDYKLIRRSSMVRARRRLKWLEDNGKDGAGGKFVAAWRGHTQWANAHHACVALKIADNSVRWPLEDCPPQEGAPYDLRWWASCG